jgi:Transposase DDE domain
MPLKVTALCAFLQVLFTTKAEKLGKETGFIQRQRKLKADDFAQTLVFQWIAKPDATVETMARHLDLSPEGLRQRLDCHAQDFLKAMLADALTNVVQACSARLGLLDCFPVVIVEDSTVVALPPELADQFPGCGGSDKDDGAAALKINIRWDVRTGRLHDLSVHAGRDSDKPLSATAADLPEGGLHLADQGYFNSERWMEFGAEKYWISRVPAGTNVNWQGEWQTIGTFLTKLSGTVFDDDVELVEKTKLPCRLVALPCPVEVANRRRQKLREQTRRKKGREPSAEQLQTCDWSVYATNVPAEKLAARQVWLVYRCRWQIELFFKRAKQKLGCSFSRGKKGQRVLTEVYAKLIGLVVTHWTTLLRGGPLCGVSPTKLFTVVAEWAMNLRLSLTQGATAFEAAMEGLAKELGRVRKQTTSRKKPSTRQNMQSPGVAA